MTTWTRRKTAIAASFVPFLASAIVLTAVVRRPGSTGRITAGGDTLSFCYAPQKPTDWARDIPRTGVMYGLDELDLSSTTAHVLVSSAELVRPTGGLSIISAGFVPGGGVDEGSDGAKGFQGPAAVAGLARTIPTVLDRTLTPEGAQQPFADLTWQLAIIFRVPDTSSSVSMAGVKLTYK